MSEPKPSKRSRLLDDDEQGSPGHQHWNPSTHPPPLARPAQHGNRLSIASSSSSSSSSLDAGALAIMLHEVEESPSGAFLLWGTCGDRTALVRVPDFAPYWFIPSCEQDSQEELSGAKLSQLQSLLNMRHPDGESFLKLSLKPGSSVRKAATAVHAVLKAGQLVPHFHFPNRQDYESEVKPLTRFMCDVGLSGGGWLYVAPAMPDAAGFKHVAPRDRVSTCDLELEVPWTCLQPLTADATQLADLTWEPPVMAQLRQPAGHDVPVLDAAAHAGLAAAHQGAILPLKVLTLDVFMAPADCASRVPNVQHDPVVAIACELFTERFGGEAAQLGAHEADDVDVQGVRRNLGPDMARAAGLPAETEVVSLLSEDAEDEIEDDDDDHVMMLGAGSGGGTGTRHKLAVAAGHQQPHTAHKAHATERVLFLLAGPAHGQRAAPSNPGPQHSAAGHVGAQTQGLKPGQELHVAGARVVVCGSETDLLLAWREWCMSRDPDAVATFQVRDTLGALAARATAIKLDASRQVAAAGVTQGGPAVRPGVMAPGLYMSRLHLHTSKPLSTKSVVMYSPAWVKSQSRMSNNSNQETFKMQGFSGRLVFDVLRQVLTHKSLATFTLVDCVESILHETMEVLAPAQLAQLWMEVQGRSTPATVTTTPAAGPSTSSAHSKSHSKSARGGGSSKHKATTAGAGGSLAASKQAGSKQQQQAGAVAESRPALSTSPEAAAERVARYCFRRTGAVRALLTSLATIPECFEMARVTGLSLNEVQYKAQMVRTWSLLLRNARRHDYVVGGRQEVGQLIESPYLMHPLEHQTAGFYTSPVACLDFASLYPSLYRAYNLCYSTLVVSEDVEAVGREHLTITPSGHAFLKPGIRQGILPSILAALMTARTRTRDALKALPPGSSPAAKAVLDSRQKALKVTANALYGFTGAQASPLQCVPLADSCLALGAQACRTAIQAVGEIHTKGLLGEAGRGARVIYGQTDSLFVLFPHATPAQAVGLGKQLAKLVSEGWCVPPMQLQYERVCAPFLLLHVNRYAGRSFETEDQAAGCRPTGLLVKGVRSMWRQSAPFVQHTLQGALERIIMQADIQGAVQHTEEQIRRLLSGRVELWELVMTGGLWRVTGQQVAAAAAAASDATPSHQRGSASTAEGSGGGEEVRGPHASLAIKLVQRDPGRTFLLGERIQYVLLTGARLQDDAAEDPLLTAELGLTPNLELYWKNKLQTPLSEIFDKVLTPAQLQSLISGPHTLVRVEQLSTSTAPGNPEVEAAAVAAAGVGSAAGGADLARAAILSKKSTGVGGKQVGLVSFFKQAVKCLACRQALPDAWVSAHQSADGLPPGLCATCLAEGRAAEVQVACVADANVQQTQLTAAVSQCMRCHSGGIMGRVACSNSECRVLYSRIGAARRLAALDVRQRRLDVHDPELW